MCVRPMCACTPKTAVRFLIYKCNKYPMRFFRTNPSPFEFLLVSFPCFPAGAYSTSGPLFLPSSSRILAVLSASLRIMELEVGVSECGPLSSGVLQDTPMAPQMLPYASSAHAGSN